MMAIELNGLLNTHYSQKHIQELLLGKPIVSMDVMRIVKLDGTCINLPQGLIGLYKESDGIYRCHGTVKGKDGNPDIKYRLEYNPADRTYKVEGEYFDRIISRLYID